ncbi:MAG: DUF1273 domain-containing protein [Ruminococcaceae bacterium]|nr:DUF1273 domain-containing protein [Oscillospiraceae bacterium]
MIGQKEENTCFFTGHRSIPESKINEVALRTREQIYHLTAQGYKHFICGGAVGFDTIAAVQVAKVKAGGADIKLILALPCRDQTAVWKNTDMLRLYQKLKGVADEIVYISELFTEGCMKERNRFMVEHSTACITYFNGRRVGGTAQTVRMAKEKNITIFNVYSPVKE